MCRLIVELRDRGPEHICPGEVITVLADTQPVGGKVSANIHEGKWMLLDVPNVPVEALVHLRQPPEDGTGKRGWCLDINKLAGLVRWPKKLREADILTHAHLKLHNGRSV